jgi:hypothetical protein
MTADADDIATLEAATLAAWLAAEPEPVVPWAFYE